MEIKDIKELVIDRAMWGQGSLLVTNSYGLTNGYLGPVGSMCCLGWLSRACGVAEQDLSGNSFPLAEWPVPEEFKRCKAPLRSALDRHAMHDGPFSYAAWPAAAHDVAQAAANINDASYSSASKEKMLIKLFGEHGITLSFVGEHWTHP